MGPLVGFHFRIPPNPSASDLARLIPITPLPIYAPTSDLRLVYLSTYVLTGVVEAEQRKTGG